MKKRLILIILTLTMVFGTACSTTVIAHPSELPWRRLTSSMAEVCIYTVKQETSNGVVTADGTVIYTLFKTLPENHADYAAYYAANEKRSLLTMSLTVTYNDRAEETVKGRTDTVKSAAVFIDESMTMIYSERIATFDRGMTTNGDEVKNDSFTLTTDYINKVSTYKHNEWVEDGTTGKIVNRPAEDSVINFSKQKEDALSRITDNETLFYYLRALELKQRKTTTGCTGGVESGGTGNIRLGSFLDMHVDGAFRTYSMAYTCAADTDEEGLISIPVGERVGSGEWGITDNKVTGIKTTLSLSSGKSGSGTPITLYYAMDPFTDNNADKESEDYENSIKSENVLLSVKTTSYAFFNAYGQYVFSLADYTTSEYTLDDYYFDSASGVDAFIADYFA